LPPTPDSADFVNRANAEYIDQMFGLYQKDPRSVPEAWRAFFAGFEVGVQRAEGDRPALPTAPLNMGVYDLVHSYRELGHFVAHLDPLGHDRANHPLLDLSNFGMTLADLDREVGTGGFVGATDGTLRDLIEKLRQTYCRTIGVEFIGISDKSQRDWLIQRMEPIYNSPQLSAEESKALLFQLIAAEEFEQYLGRAFIGAKRFSLEGAESFNPLCNTIIDHGDDLGGEQFIFAMAHRGRLNALAHVLNKPYEVILSEFMGTALPTVDDGGDGDVKYHLGYANSRPAPRGGKTKVSLLPNPSHLELIDPIQQGIVRCKQLLFGDAGRSHVVPICVHGDAAFTGQGIVQETLNLSELPNFRTGGTIHVIINNQIGFTTPPRQERFTPYPTDLAKAIQAPIFHVNGDDPEAVVWAARLAIEFRQQFKCDVMIDLWCYRRHGHNEQDEASFTQPVMYREIEQHKTTRQLYAERLLNAGIVTEQDLEEMKATVIHRLDTARELAKEVRPRQKVPTFSGAWRGLGRAPGDVSQWNAATKVDRATLTRIIDVLKNLPQDFTSHPKLARILSQRVEMVHTGQGIDWGCAEHLAFGSLLLEGHNVRLTGQDVERGTFSHRHDVLHDYNNGETYIPLQHLDSKQGWFSVTNSMLSELAVLGFEWGFASADPKNLVLWEAQFGDFVNGAQPIIDQILYAAESKWRYMNGMVMLLPHGYEGQGPEHSNAYLERFLSLCAENNVQVAVPSAPGQYFHLLRRQIHRKFRKPLVLMMPKSMLRDPHKTSTIEEFTDGAFQPVIDDPCMHAVSDGHEKIRRVLICSGKIYYTLRDAREAAKSKHHPCDDITIVRVEQLYPFPEKELSQILASYGRKQEVCWVQEEPKNRGGWSFIEPRLRAMLPDTIVTYIGRDAAASPATGSMKDHQREEREIIAAAMELSVRSGAVKQVTQPGTAATAISPTPVSG
jgi:2-oxoglutarate dehydrogenase E1 component